MPEPVVFIHGVFQMLADLPAQEYFAPRPVLVPDLLGFGKNAAALREQIALPAQADYVASQIRSAGWEKAHVVGHSVGGAVAVLLARRHPQHVASLINVEGNFTLKDAFWSQKLAAMSEAEVEGVIESYRGDVAGWLTRGGIAPTRERVACAEHGLRAQSASTVRALAQSVVAITSRPDYLDDVRVVLESRIPFHLVAGEKSLSGWDVPEFVERGAASLTIQPGVGHMMTLEEPRGFLQLVAGLIPD
jgi:pimeloyl-ACP methyl ester carboxylesterase